MSERKRVGSDGGIIQYSDEITGRVPFSGARGRRRVRVTGENVRGMVRYMRRKLNWRSRYAYGGVLPARTSHDDRIPARLSPSGRLVYRHGDHSGSNGDVDGCA